MIFLFFIMGIGLRTLMFFSEKSFWGDEFFSIGLAHQSFSQVIQGAIQDVHPPLYFLLLRGIVGLLGEADWTFRLLSFFSGLGLLVAIYLLARELLNKNQSLIVLYLSAISPYWLQSANEVRSYSLLSFVTCLGTFFLTKAVKEPTVKKWRWAYFIMASLAVYVEHYAWFWLMGATAYLVFLYFKEKQGGPLIVFHSAALIFSMLLLPLVLYQAVYREGVFNFERIREYLPLFVLTKKVGGIFWHLTCGYFYSMITVHTLGAHLKTSVFFWSCVFTTLLALFIVGREAAGLMKTRLSEFVFFVTVLFLPVIFLAAFYSIRLDARYLSFAAPFYFLLLGAGVGTSKRWLKAVFLTLFTIVNLSGAVRAIASPMDAIHKEDHKNMVAYVVKHSEPGDAICGLKLQVDYYLKTMSWSFKGTYFDHLETFFSSHERTFKRFWMLDSVNMHPRVTDPHYERVKKRMGEIGFYPAMEPMVFGGPEALTRLYLFEPLRKNQT